MIPAIRSRLRGRNPAQIAGLTLKTLRHRLAMLGPAARAARVADAAFDRRWGTDTSTGVSVHDLGFDPARVDHFRRYDPSSEAMLRAPVAILGLNPADHHFIDYGAGKGRVLMLAMEMGFASVTGVELSARLCQVARANIARFAAQHPGMTPAAVAEVDATRFAPAGRRRIVAYFYNPFDAVVMTAVRERLEQVLAEDTAEVVVIYANPEHAPVFADAPGWTERPGPPGVAIFTACAPTP